jgi:two-component sensor histidine kinase
MLFPAMQACTRIPADLRAPYRARRWIGELQMPLAPNRADAVELLVAELVTAAVKRAMADGVRFVDVALRAVDGVVHLDVSDPGRRVRPDVPERPDEATGFGFYLVDKLADRWGVNDGGAAGLWFELDIYDLPSDSAVSA